MADTETRNKLARNKALDTKVTTSGKEKLEVEGAWKELEGKLVLTRKALKVADQKDELVTRVIVEGQRDQVYTKVEGLEKVVDSATYNGLQWKFLCGFHDCK